MRGALYALGSVACLVGWISLNQLGSPLGAVLSYPAGLLASLAFEELRS